MSMYDVWVDISRPKEEVVRVQRRYPHWDGYPKEVVVTVNADSPDDAANKAIEQVKQHEEYGVQAEVSGIAANLE